MLEIALRTTSDRSFLIGGLKSAIFDLMGDLSNSDDLDSISISILEKKRPVLMCQVYVLLLAVSFKTLPTFLGTNYLGVVLDIFCSRIRVIPSIR